jgi:hypothetical protein
MPFTIEIRDERGGVEQQTVGVTLTHLIPAVDDWTSSPTRRRLHNGGDRGDRADRSPPSCLIASRLG